MQTFKFAGRTNIATQGTTFHYLQSENPVFDDRLDIYANGQIVARLVPGDEVQLPQPAQQWELVPLSQQQGGLVMVGQGRLRRLTTRYQRDVATQNTIREIEFSGFMSRTAAAGQFPVVMFEARTTPVLVRAFNVNTNAAGTVRWFRHDGQPTLPLQERPLFNRLASGAPVSCVMSVHDSASATAPVVAGVTFGDQVNERIITNSGNLSIYASGQLFVLMPGQGLSCVHSLAATTLIGNVDVQALQLGTSWETF